MGISTGARRALEAAWSRAAIAIETLRCRARPSEALSLFGPSLFFVLAVSLLTYDHVRGAVSELVFWIGIGIVVIVFIWLLERVGRSTRLIESRNLELLRDSLTGLGSSEALREDLLAAAAIGDPACLIVVEVETHPNDAETTDPVMRDNTIRRLGADLGTSVRSAAASAYRLGGVRFAVLAPAEGPLAADELVTRTRAALGRDGQGSLLSGHYGEVRIPEEATDPERALQIVEERLAHRKRRGRRSARRQAHAALVAAIGARRPHLRDHLRSVVPLVITVGRRLGLDQEELDDVVLAAGLQDVGMLTVPEAVLEKRGPLSVEERALIRKHPLAGERIVGAASSLEPVAALVRSAYERWDGSGYPDGLEGEEIPLGARIIAPCVAAAAMTAPRPHREALEPAEAVNELRTSAGSQFDPSIVEVLIEELAVPDRAGVETLNGASTGA